MPKIPKTRYLSFTDWDGDEKEIRCPHCKEKYNQIWDGHNASGSRRVKCKICGRKYTPEPNPKGYSDFEKIAVFDLARDWHESGWKPSLRQIAYRTEISRQTIANWFKAHNGDWRDVSKIPQIDIT